jgi:hypothetical protein
MMVKCTIGMKRLSLGFLCLNSEIHVKGESHA